MPQPIRLRRDTDVVLRILRYLIVFTFILMLSFGRAHAACGPDATPAIAAAQGLTCEVFVDNWVTNQNLSSIDTGNTLTPSTCSSATYPNGVCHWYVNNRWANAAQTVCYGCASDFSSVNLPPTTTYDYSVSGSGLLLQPYSLTVTGNTVLGSNQLTNISATTGIATAGNAVVTGPGVPNTSSQATSFTLSGTTATMSANATSTNTGATYVLKNVHNGWMLQSCGYSASGYVGTAFTGDMYVQIDATIGTQGSLWSVTQSEPEFWTWPIEMFNGGPPSSSVPLNIMEMDFFDSDGTAQRAVYNEQFLDGQVAFQFGDSTGAPGPFYSYQVAQGSTPFGTLVMSPGSNAGGTNIGLVSFDSNGTTYGTMKYGPSITPSATVGSGVSGSTSAGSFTLLPQQHYCLMLDGAADYNLTVRSVKVWQAPPAAGGGRRSVLFK